MRTPNRTRRYCTPFMNWSALIATVALVAFTTTVLRAQAPFYYATELGSLGGSQTRALDVNQYGVVVGESQTALGTYHAFIWRDGVMTDLGTLPGRSTSLAQAVNNLDEVVGTSDGRAFYWDDGVMTEIPLPSGAGASFAYDINLEGRVCGFYYNASGDARSFWWEPGWSEAITIAQPSGYTDVFAYAINNNRFTACFGYPVSGNPDSRAWRARYTDFAFVPGQSNGNHIAMDINGPGAMTGQYTTSGGDVNAFHWTPSSFTPISPFSGDVIIIGFGINDDDQIVGYSRAIFGDPDAFVWINGTKYRLDNRLKQTGIPHLSRATSINNRGQITVNTEEFIGEAYLLTPIPSKGFILMPDSTSDVVHVLDPANGTPLGSFDVGFANTPIEIIDGNGSDILMSDQVADTIWRMTTNGGFNGEFVQQPVYNIRGIAKSLAGYIVGASINGFHGWQSNGVEVNTNLGGNLFDVVLLDLPKAKRYLVSDTGTDNVRSYDLNLNFKGQLPQGSVDFPEQMALMTDLRLAVGGFDDYTVRVYDLKRGRLLRSFTVPGSVRGLIQISQDSLLVSTNNGLYHYYTSGIQDRQIMSGSGFRYLNQVKNYLR